MFIEKSPEQRMIEFIDYLKDSGQVRFKKEVFDKTGIRRQRYVAVRNGSKRFTTTQVMALCKHYPVNANWIFGTEDNMLKKNRNKTVHQLVHKAH